MAATALGCACRCRIDGGTGPVYVRPLQYPTAKLRPILFPKPKQQTLRRQNHFRFHHGYFVRPDCRPLRCASTGICSGLYRPDRRCRIGWPCALYISTRHRRTANHHRHIRRSYPAQSRRLDERHQIRIRLYLTGRCRIPCHTASALLRSSRPLHLADDCSRPYAFGKIWQTKRPSENSCRRIGLFTADWRLMVWLAKL